jgi:hypothetical protein
MIAFELQREGQRMSELLASDPEPRDTSSLEWSKWQMRTQRRRRLRKSAYALSERVNVTYEIPRHEVLVLIRRLERER